MSADEDTISQAVKYVDIAGRGEALLSLVRISGSLGDYEARSSYQLQIVNLVKEVYETADGYLLRGQYDVAFGHLSTALELAEMLEIDGMRAVIYLKMGGVFGSKMQYAEAIRHLEHAQDASSE